MTEEPETTYIAGDALEPLLDSVFDIEPAAIFTPLELQGLLRNAYNWQARARADLFNAARTVEFRKRELRQKQTVLRMGEGYGLLKNAEQREAYLASECAELVALCEAAENEQAEARLYFDNAGAEVEQARAMLRIAELAQAAPSDDSIFPSLLIPKKKKKDG